MATEIVRWCDPCMADDVRTPGVAHAVQVDGRDGAVDLCDQHGKTLLGPLLEVLQMGVRMPGKGGRKAVPGPAPCPVCGTQLRPERMSSHLRKSHDMDTAAAYGLACPLCDFVAETAQGLGSHGRLHGVTDGVPGLHVLAAAEGGSHG